MSDRTPQEPTRGGYKFGGKEYHRDTAMDFRERCYGEYEPVTPKLIAAGKTHICLNCGHERVSGDRGKLPKGVSCREKFYEETMRKYKSKARA
jgi:hypothetical protein